MLNYGFLTPKRHILARTPYKGSRFCMWIDIQDVITYASFGDDRLKGLGVERGRISHFPIDLRRRPYNTRPTVRVCDIKHTVM